MKKINFLTILGTAILSAQDVLAQSTNAQQNPLMSFLPLILIFVVFYFLLIRPQKKRMQEEQNMLNKLAKGDEIFTKSGVIGTIAGLTDKIVTVEVSEGVRVKYLRGQIGGLSRSLLAEKNEKSSKK